MGIRTTRELSRERMIERILEIEELHSQKNYRGLEETTFDPDYSVQQFIDENIPSDFTQEQLDSYTDKMLEDLMDKPFYRFSMFDNYQVSPDVV